MADGSEMDNMLKRRFRVADDDDVNADRLSSALDFIPGLGGLTPQEQRVLERVATGMTNKQIARSLGISPRTVKNYLSNTFQKLQVTCRMRAAFAFRELQRGAGMQGGDAEG